jgi:hypothetical protein
LREEGDFYRAPYTLPLHLFPIILTSPNSFLPVSSHCYVLPRRTEKGKDKGKMIK